MILITGDYGFVGQHLTKELKEWKGFDLYRGQDIRDKYQLEQVFLNYQITKVIHLAARAGVRQSKLYPEEFISTNILGTQNIVNLCNKYKVKRLIFYSSSSVYGGLVNSPVKEHDWKQPISLYGITKLAGENIVNNAECQTIIIRPFTVYGENGRKDEVIYKWLQQIKVGKPITVYDEDSFRGYVYVKDLIKATIKLLDIKLDNQHEEFNLGGSEVIYLRDLLDIFKKNFSDLKIDKQERLKEDLMGQYANIDNAKIKLHFIPEPKFKKVVQRIIDENINIHNNN